MPHGELVIPVLNQECSSGRVLIMVPYFPRLFRHTGLTVGTLSVSKALPDATEPERFFCADNQDIVVLLSKAHWRSGGVC